MQNDALYIVIQARLSSTRLPNKILLPLGKRSVLEVMLHRLQRFKNNIIIATNNDGTQSPLVKKMLDLEMNVYQGDTDNVLERFVLALRREKAKESDIVVRLTSDCPFMDANVLQEMIEKFQKEQVDYLSNTLHRTFARGVDIEIMCFSALEKAYHNAETLFEKEHVTPYIHTTHQEAFTHYSFEDKENRAHYRITLDEQADYEMLQALFNVVGEDADYDEIIRCLDNAPEIAILNRDVEQKKC
jgi:spore coat polysaccharide biosynthesis protein SpsF